MAAHADALATRTPQPAGRGPDPRLVASMSTALRAGARWPLMFRPVVDGELVTTPRRSTPSRTGPPTRRPLLVGATREEMVAALRHAGDGRRPSEPAVGPARPRPRRRARPIRPRRRRTTASATAAPPPTPGSVSRRCGPPRPDSTPRRRPSCTTSPGDPRPGRPRRGHCIDLPFAWDLLDADGVETVAGADPPQALADRMHRAWVSFVTDGDPGWPAYR